MAQGGPFDIYPGMDSYTAPKENFVAVGDPPTTTWSPTITVSGNPQIAPLIPHELATEILDHERKSKPSRYDSDPADKEAWKRAKEMTDWLFKKLKEQYGS